MKTFCKILLLLLIPAAFLGAENLKLDSERYEDGLYIVSIPEGLESEWNIGTLYDLYGGLDEVDGRKVLVDYADTVVLVAIDGPNLSFAPLWDGQPRMLDGEYILSDAGRSIETATPERDQVVASVQRAARDRRFKKDWDLGVLTNFSNYGATTQLNFRFGAHAAAVYVNALVLDGFKVQYGFWYLYNIMAWDRFQPYFGGGYGIQMEPQDEMQIMTGPEIVVGARYFLMPSLSLKVQDSFAVYIDIADQGVVLNNNLGIGIGLHF